MDIQITGRKVNLDAVLRSFVERRLQFAFGRFERRIAAVNVRLADINGPRGGIDQSCRIMVHFRPRGELIIEDKAGDTESAVMMAAQRAGQAVRREIDRRRTARMRRTTAAA